MKKKKINLCLTKQVLNMFKLWCEWGISLALLHILAPFRYACAFAPILLIFSAVFSWAIDNCFEMFFEEGWNSMSSLPPFQTLRMTWGYFNNQSANKTEKKAEDLKFEIWFSDNRDAHMRLQIFKVSLEMLICLTSMNHEVVCGDDREIFVTIIEGSSEFDLILLQLWNKIV